MDMSSQDPFFVAGFDVTADADTEFNQWYDTVHIPDALGIGGFRSVTRLVRAGEYDNTFGPKYLNLYQVSSQSDFEAGWDTDYRRASSADFNRWGPALSNGHVGLYVPFER